MASEASTVKSSAQLTPIFLAKETQETIKVREHSIANITGMALVVISIVNDYLIIPFTWVAEALPEKEAQKLGAKAFSSNPTKLAHLKTVRATSAGASIRPSDFTQPYMRDSYERHEVSATHDRLAYATAMPGGTHLVLWDMSRMSFQTRKIQAWNTPLVQFTSNTAVIVAESRKGYADGCTIHSYDMQKSHAKPTVMLKVEKRVEKAHIDTSRGRLYLSYLRTDRHETQVESFDTTKYRSVARITNELPAEDAHRFYCDSISTNPHHIATLYIGRVNGDPFHSYVAVHSIDFGKNGDTLSHLATFRVNHSYYDACSLIDNRLVLRTKAYVDDPSRYDAFEFNERARLQKSDVAETVTTSTSTAAPKDNGCVVM